MATPHPRWPLTARGNLVLALLTGSMLGGLILLVILSNFYNN